MCVSHEMIQIIIFILNTGSCQDTYLWYFWSLRNINCLFCCIMEFFWNIQLLLNYCFLYSVKKYFKGIKGSPGLTTNLLRDSSDTKNLTSLDKVKFFGKQGKNHYVRGRIYDFMEAIIDLKITEAIFH